MARHFGYIPNPQETAEILADRSTPIHEVTSGERAELRVGSPKEDRDAVILFDALQRVHPTWRRGAQGIGDCVSWGFELMATLHHAVDIVVKGLPWEWRGEYATEPLYGGGRVEARGRRTGGWGDGSYGGAQIKWMTQWGCLLRIDYSVATGVTEHDLRQYDSRKAKNWGNYGCGGQHDKGKLDAVAKETPVVEGRLVTTYDEAVALIENGYPVAVCSGQGFGKRGSDGFAPPRGSWAHCMAFTGVRYDKPGLLLSNSWGNSWGTHAMPHVEWDQVRRCSAWCDPRTAGRMLAGRDSYAGVGIDGLKRRKIDWGSGWTIVS